MWSYQSQGRLQYNGGILDCGDDQPIAVALVGADGPDLPSVELKTATAPSLA